METILNIGGLIFHGELENARTAWKGIHSEAGTTVQASTSCVGVRVSSTTSDCECRGDMEEDIRDSASYFSRSIDTESTPTDSGKFAFPFHDSMTKDSSIDDMLNSTLSDFSRASHSDYSDSMCTDLSNYAAFPDADAESKRGDGEARMENDSRQDTFECVTRKGLQDEWCERDLPDEGAYSTPFQRTPSFVSQIGEEVCLVEPACSEVVMEAGKKPGIKSPKSNRMSFHLERAKKNVRGSVKSPATVNDIIINTGRSRVSPTNIDAGTVSIAATSSRKLEPTRKAKGFFQKIRPEESTPWAIRIRGAFLATRLQNKIKSTVEKGGNAPRPTSPESKDTISLASISQSGMSGLQAGSEPGSTSTTIDLSHVPSPTLFIHEEQECSANDRTENSVTDVRSCNTSCEEKKASMSDNDDLVYSPAADNEKVATCAASGGLYGEATCEWIKNAAVAASPRNLLGDKWKVLESAKENTIEVLLNCMDQINNFCDTTKEAGITLHQACNNEVTKVSDDVAEDTVVINQPPGLCSKQSITSLPTDDQSETKDLMNVKPKNNSSRFVVHLSRFTKSNTPAKESIVDEDAILAHILDEIYLETEKLKMEKDKLIKGKIEGGDSNVVVADVADDDIELPQGFSDLIANEISEEFGMR